MYDFLIVGAGISGAVFAHEVHKAGKKCLVIDSRGMIGGSLYCENMRGIPVHCYGLHILQTDDRRVWEFLNSFGKFVPCRERVSEKQYEGVPEKGYTQIIRKLLKDCDVYLNTDYNRFRKEKPDIADKVFYTGRLDEYFGEEYGRLVYELRSYETELRFQKHYQKRMLEKVRGKNAQIIEHKYLTGIYDKKHTPFTVITKESWGKNLKDGVPGMLENTEKNRMLFRKYRMLAGKEKRAIFGGRMFHEGSYGIDEAVRDAMILAEKYAGKKMGLSH